MAYSFKPTDQTVAKGAGRIADAQLSVALTTIADPGLTLDQKVHAVRRRIKKVRALVRLVRYVFPSYTDENAILRRAARRLGPARDAAVMIETLDRMADIHAGHLDKEIMRPLRGRLVGNRQAMSDAEIGAALLRTEIDLRGCHERLRDIELSDEEAPAYEDGLAKVYDRNIAVLEVARHSRDVEDIHKWRKWAKYHWLHVRLLRHIWPEGLEPRAMLLDQLTDDLGEHHDLSVLCALLKTLPTKEGAVTVFLEGPAAARLTALEEHVFEVGENLFTEEPDVFARRCAAYWAVWRQDDCMLTGTS